MNKNIKQKWVEALRSGDYEQGQEVLKSGDKFCCLGVLCDLHAKATDDDWDEFDSYFTERSLLPYKVMTWAGLESEDPVVKEACLSSHNDGYRCIDTKVTEKSFDEIADLIEEHL